jgi:predicted TIM-barrel enzyme
LGKVGQRAIRLVSTLASSGNGGDVLILCPFLAGLDPVMAMWLGPLAWYDCNAKLLEALAAPVPAEATVFAGVFCADPFRRPADLLPALCGAGIAGVVNLPSVTFFDGEVGQTLQALHLGRERELDFLRAAKAWDLGVGLCTCEAEDARAMVRAGAEFVITHGGPPLPGRETRRQVPGFGLAQTGVRTVPLPSLLSAGRPS